MGFEHLWYLVLLLPAFLFWWYIGKKAYFLLAILVVAVLILAKPFIPMHTKGCHVVLVVDCSLSVSSDGAEKIKEQINRALDLESDSNRLSIVTFGRNVAIEKIVSEKYSFEQFNRFIDAESSNLNDAIAMACSLIRVNEQGKILLMTDGLYHGSVPYKAASEAYSRGIVIDGVFVADEWNLDVSVGDFHLPSKVNKNQVFQFSIEIQSNYNVTADYVLKRNDIIIKKGKLDLLHGSNQLPVIDRVAETGVASYTLMVDAEGDNYNVNDVGKGVVSVDGDKGILVVNATGRPDNFTRALEGVGHSVTVIGTQSKMVDLNYLAGFKTLVLENVPANAFDEKELKSMRTFVEDQGMSLLMTGGRASFGMGGYVNSPLEEILPIDMTPKLDTKQLSTALCVVLDRSGSMLARTPSGKAKMDLANMGSVSAMDLLKNTDELSVIAVDSSPHIIVPMQSIGDNRASITKKVLSIESQGGGIFTYTGLKAGAIELSKSKMAVRHMIIFADASDAEEPGEYKQLCRELVSSGVTVSVIAMGTEGDSDADFLKDLAMAGGGNVYFSVDVDSLPRLFTQDVINVARPSFAEERFQLKVLPQLSTLGNFTFDSMPSVNGVNFNYVKEGAINCVLAETDYINPVLSFMKVGAGKTMAIGFEVDGPFTGEIQNWNLYDNFLGNILKSLMPTQESSIGVLEANRKGDFVELFFYYDPENLILDFRPNVQVINLNAVDDKINVALRPLGPGVLTGEYRLKNSLVHHHLLKIRENVVIGNAVQLPYSPEYEIQNKHRRDVVRNISERSGGKIRVLVNDELWQNYKPVLSVYYIQYPLYILLMLLILLDIMQRRLGLRMRSLILSAGKKKTKPQKETEKQELEADEFYLLKIKNKKNQN